MSDYAHPGSPERPPVPMARPVSAAPAGQGTPMDSAPAGEGASLAYAPAAPAAMLSRPRALIELLALIPAAVVGSVVAGGVLRYLVEPNWPVFDGRWHNLVSSLIVGLTLLAAVALMVRLNGQGAQSIGWTSRRFLLNAWIGLVVLSLSYFLAMIVIAGILLLSPEILDHEPEAQRAIRETFPPLSLAALVGVMLFVAIWEEVVFRGFMLSRLYALLRRWWLVLPVGALLFAVPHIYQGVLAVAMIIILALIMGTLFIWRRSLVSPIVFHFIHNVVVMLVLSKLVEWE